jgi:hypothetical protein
MISYPRKDLSFIHFIRINEAHHLIIHFTDDLRPRDKREGSSKRPASPSPSPQPSSRQRKDPSPNPEVDPSLAQASQQQLVQPSLTQPLSITAEPSTTQEQDTDHLNDDIFGRMFIHVTSLLSILI